MKIGYSSRWLFLEDKEVNIFEELKYAYSLGFEIFGLNLDRKQNQKLKDNDLVKLRKLANDYRMKIIVRSPHHLNTSLKNKKLTDEVRRNIQIARLVGSDRLMIHPGHIMPKLELDYNVSKSYKGRKREELGIPEKSIKQQFSQLISNLKEIVKFASKYNIKIALENNGEHYQYGSNLKEYLSILKKVKRLYASISTGHANISGNNVYTYVSKCKGKIINLDLHDNHGISDEHLPIGEGNIDFRKILVHLKNNKNLTCLIDTYSNQLVTRSLSNFQKIMKTI